MTEKKMRKESAKTRYDAKKPTVSFRVSREEYERLDRLRRTGMSFRSMILTGAGMIESRAKEERDKEMELQRLERAVEDAERMALKRVVIGNCMKCGRPLSWNLTDKEQRSILAGAIRMAYVYHKKC